ncbi:serine/threonine/tyrosine-interacting-like protein 1 isoform X3 [Convolutriloba macropyga]|uniref:serine/threonine/tyrosine-interacting-like protein 1 isoform X3 n=1 Tax=Convolutriloba macropyga TaxID=536237 RepID=UPI003F524FE4
MNRIKFVEPSKLYNIIQQRLVYPSVSDNNYLLILDARAPSEYAESHIITAKLAPRQDDGQWKVPYEAELECKEFIVVYDGKTSSQEQSQDEAYSDAIQLAKFLVAQGSKNAVLIADGGYEKFSALYPFLRTKKILYMPKHRDESKYDPCSISSSLATLSKHGPIADWRNHDFYRNTLELDVIVTYPTEIVPGKLYTGSLAQALDKRIQKDLKVRAHVAVTTENQTYFPEEDESKVLRVGIEDEIESDLLSSLEKACHFIDDRIANSGGVVLIYSNLGISRSSAVALAYLIHSQKKSLKDAWAHVMECQRSTRPNRGFVKQLSQWEEKVLGEMMTNIDDPAF